MCIYISMKILSWNVRGLGRDDRRRRVKEFLRQKNVDMVLLQETKKSNIDDNVIRSLWPSDSVEYMEVDAEGSAGGILCIWNPMTFSLQKCCCSRNFILLAGIMHSCINCVIGNIYAPNEDMNRRRLWGILSNLKTVFSDPWCLGGDFNQVKNICERKGCIRRDRGMEEFGTFISNLELVDIPMLGRQYTGGNSQSWSRIDRFLVNPEWLEWYRYKVWGLPRLFSDHSPILPMEDDRNWGPKPFKFINAWILHPKFLLEANKVWDSTYVQGWASFIIMEKLRALKVALKKWNAEVFGDVEAKLKEAENELHSMDLQSELRVLTEVEEGQRKEIRGLIWKLSKRKEWMWVLKSRMDWALKGDRILDSFILWPLRNTTET